MKVSYYPEEFGGHSHSGSGDIMFLICHMISQEHVRKGHVAGSEPLMLSLNLVKFAGHRHCSSKDLMPLVVKRQDSRCPCLNPPLLFISEVQSMPFSHPRNFRT